MRLITAIVFVCLTAACSEPELMVVDSACTEQEIAAIERAIEKLNEAANEDVMEVWKVREVDYDSPMDNTIVCVRDTEEALSRWPFMQGLLGRLSGFNIILRTDIIPSIGGVEKVSMHELIHWLGYGNEDHSVDPRDIFCPGQYLVENPEYSDFDVDMILRSPGIHGIN